MKILYLVTITVIALSPLFVQAAKKRSMLEVYNITCESFSNYLKQIRCNFTKVGNGRFLISGGTLNDGQDGKDIDLRIRVRLTPRNGTISYNLFDMQFNMCKLTTETFRNVLLRKVFNELIRTSNYPFDCSYRANYWYTTKNYLLTDEFIPVWVPYLNGTVSLDYLQNRQIMWNFVVYFALVPRGKN